MFYNMLFKVNILSLRRLRDQVGVNKNNTPATVMRRV